LLHPPLKLFLRRGIAFPVHPQMLRHATSYYLAANGQDARAIQA
jgi:site-specific recombinase XerD